MLQIKHSSIKPAILILSQKDPTPHWVDGKVQLVVNPLSHILEGFSLLKLTKKKRWSTGQKIM